MSSHREAPEISKDPVADSTDVYAFMSPDKPGMVTLIANYIPLEAPDGGPNFYEFADDVLYEIHIDNTGDGNPDISYQFRFTTVNNIPSSFLYNDGPITSLTPPVAFVQLESPADIHADPRRQQSTQSLGRLVGRVGMRASVPAVQHRAAVDSELRRPGSDRRALRRGRTLLGRGVRRAAGRGLLRRLGRGLRPRGSARLRRRSRGWPGGRPHERHARRELDRRRQRAHAGAADSR